MHPNAHQLELPSHIHTSDVFNVKHLIPFHGDNSSDKDNGANSRSNFLQSGDDDAAQSFGFQEITFWLPRVITFGRLPRVITTLLFF